MSRRVDSMKINEGKTGTFKWGISQKLEFLSQKLEFLSQSKIWKNKSPAPALTKQQL